MKKLLIITDTWHPQINGVVVAIQKLKETLEGKNVTVVIVHPEMFLNFPSAFYPGIRICVFPGRKLRRIVVAANPDFIHIATEGPLGLAGRLLCKRQGFLYTTAYHTHFQLYVHVRFRRFLGLAYGLLCWFHKEAKRTMVATPGLKNALEAHNFRNLALWPLGVDTSTFIRNASPPLSALPTPVFTYFGRLAPEKSPEEFFRLSLPGTKLVIGDGPDRARLEAKYGTTAKFLGYKQGQELVDWLSLSDVLVFPSRTETFGLVILEALACGIPVAAHDVMGPRDIITHGVEGYLSEDLEEAALACLNLSRDACRAKALLYTWDKSADAFLKNLVSARSGSNYAGH